MKSVYLWPSETSQILDYFIRIEYNKGMVDDPNEIVLDILRAIRNDVGDIKADVHEIKLRVTSLEEGLAGVHRRMDRFDERLSRIEKRNELVDA